MSESIIDTVQGREVGRYVLYGEIAAGGMATIHLGRLCGPAGFSRTVALKRLHPQLASNPHFVTMFLDEARLAGRIQHPNAVVPVDVVVERDELFLVMEYVAGETLGQLFKTAKSRGERFSPAIACAILANVLHGLHAAHEATSEHGHALNIVHRDVSPQNIMVGHEGIARILDFGVAKAATRASVTAHGSVRGKLGYMAPEQLCGQPIDRRTDVFAAGIVLWEALTLESLFRAPTDAETMGRVLRYEIPAPSSKNPAVSAALDKVVLRALSREPSLRYQTAEEFAHALEDAISVASRREVETWLSDLAADVLHERAERVSLIESSSLSLDHLVSSPPSSDLLPVSEKSPQLGPSAFSITVGPSQEQEVRDRFGWAVLAACLIAVVVLAFLMPLPRTEKTATAITPDRVVAAQPQTIHGSARRLAVDSTPQADIVVAPILVAYEPSEPNAAPASKSDVVRKRALPKPQHKPVAQRLAEAPMREEPKSKCDPPYVIDAKGIRRVKHACM